MKKYELTGETKEARGVMLKRIRAVLDFGGVRAGDIGGWIEKEENLSHDGDARVYGNAQVYGNARVYGDALVSGDAWVYGGEWEKSPCYIQGARWPIFVSSPDTVRCGCQNHTWQGWHDRYAEISEEHGADDVLEEYIRYFNLLCEMYGHEDCKIEGHGGGREPERINREEVMQ